jgi:hypothetical protein
MTINDLKETKTHVGEWSVNAQCLLNGLGIFHWSDNKHLIPKEDAKFLYIHKELAYTYGDNLDEFKRHENKEITLTELFSVKSEEKEKIKESEINTLENNIRAAKKYIRDIQESLYLADSYIDVLKSNIEHIKKDRC